MIHVCDILDYPEEQLLDVLRSACSNYERPVRISYEPQPYSWEYGLDTTRGEAQYSAWQLQPFRNRTGDLVTLVFVPFSDYTLIVEREVNAYG